MLPIYLTGKAGSKRNGDEKEMKTLKDLDDGCPVCGQGITYSDIDLQEAAREWKKEIDNAILNNKAISHKPFWEKDKEILGDAWIAHYFSVRAWIKHFFNLE